MVACFVGSVPLQHVPEARHVLLCRLSPTFNDAKVLMEVSTGLGPAMVGINDII
jgi:pyridoxal biosynthesis lyase PdxS